MILAAPNKRERNLRSGVWESTNKRYKWHILGWCHLWMASKDAFGLGILPAGLRLGQMLCCAGSVSDLFFGTSRPLRAEVGPETLVPLMT